MEGYGAKVAGIYVTRKCNLNCGYCSVKNKEINELSIEQWIDTVDILNKMGVKRLTILGGEPTIKPGLDKLIYHLAHNTNISFSLVSNGTGDFEVIKKLVQAGLENYSSGIDTMHDESLDSDTNLKSKRALENFSKVRELNVKHMTSYIVLSAITLSQVIEIAKKLTKEKVWLYIIPYHYDQNNITFWETRDKVPNKKLILGEGDIPKLEEVINTLIEMKRNGYLIENSEEYLRGLVSNVRSFTWHCGHFISELRIDADGKIMCCHDYRGPLTSNYTIFDLADEKKYHELENSRMKDAEKCPGCYWPSQYRSIE